VNPHATASPPGAEANPDALRARLRQWQRYALSAGVLGVVLCVVGVLVNPRQAAFSYLFGYLFWTGFALGRLALYMLHALTGGGWGFVIRRFLESAMATLPGQAVLFVPLFFALRQLYGWAQPGTVAHDEILERQRWYLNTPGFVLRAVIVWGIWLLMAHLLQRWSREQDRTPDPAPTRRMRTLSGPGIVVHAFIGTVAAIDWIMVLESDWYSTIFPALFLISQMLTSMACCIVLLVVFRPMLPWQGWITSKQFLAVGNLMLAFVLLWTYLMVSQLIIIWSGNLPREILWYLHRSAGGWKIVAALLVFFQFFVPFFVLLFRINKLRPRVLASIAAGVLCVHIMETFWRIEPSLHPHGFHLSWLDFAAFLGVGGLWLANFFFQLSRRLDPPRNDPRLAVAFPPHAHQADIAPFYATTASTP
jgi:hypothetical protein